MQSHIHAHTGLGKYNTYTPTHPTPTDLSQGKTILSDALLQVQQNMTADKVTRYKEIREVSNKLQNRLTVNAQTKDVHVLSSIFFPHTYKRTETHCYVHVCMYAYIIIIKCMYMPVYLHVQLCKTHSLIRMDIMYIMSYAPLPPSNYIRTYVRTLRCSHSLLNMASTITPDLVCLYVRTFELQCYRATFNTALTHLALQSVLPG